MSCVHAYYTYLTGLPPKTIHVSGEDGLYKEAAENGILQKEKVSLQRVGSYIDKKGRNQSQSAQEFPLVGQPPSAASTTASSPPMNH